MDRIFITDLRVDAVIGILPHERLAPQPLVLDLELAADVITPARSGDIADALDYKALSDGVRAFVAASEERLIETLAERICAFVRQEFGVPWLRLVLHKPEALDGPTDVGVIVERGTRPAPSGEFPAAFVG